MLCHRKGHKEMSQKLSQRFRDMLSLALISPRGGGHSFIRHICWASLAVLRGAKTNPSVSRIKIPALMELTF